MRNTPGMDTTEERLGYATFAEKALVGSLIMDRNTIIDVAELLKPASFTNPRYGDIYAAVEAMWQRRIPADIMSVSEELRSRGSGVTFLELSELLAAGIHEYTPVHARHYARRIYNAERYRSVQRAWEEASTAIAADPDMDPAEAVSAAVGLVASTGPTTGGALPTSRLIAETMDRIDQERAGTLKRIVTRSGLGAIDGLCGGGIAPGELLILAARPSMGKTALAVQWGLQAGGSGTGRSMIFSLEMDADSILRRALANVAYVDFDRINENRLSAQEYAKVSGSAEIIADANMYIDDTPGITAEQIAVRVQRALADGPVSLVVVDYLELVGDTQDREDLRLTGIAKRLKRLAREANVPVILLAQVSRKAEDRTPPLPRMSDLRWSGSLEAIADKVAFLYREDYYIDKDMLDASFAEEAGAGVTQFRLDKHRNGATGVARVKFDGPKFSFRAMPRREIPPRQPELVSADT